MKIKIKKTKDTHPMLTKIENEITLTCNHACKRCEKDCVIITKAIEIVLKKVRT